MSKANHSTNKYVKNLGKYRDISLVIFVVCTNQITGLFRQAVENCASKVAREGKLLSCTQSPNLKVTLSAINTPHAMKQYFVCWFLSDGNWKCCVSSVRASKLVCLLDTPAGDAFGGRSEHRTDDITVAVAAAFHSRFVCVYALQRHSKHAYTAAAH